MRGKTGILPLIMGAGGDWRGERSDVSLEQIFAEVAAPYPIIR